MISGIYIWSLLGLLNLKSSVKQRRVFSDLIYVNLIILAMDILVVILLYLNQVRGEIVSAPANATKQRRQVVQWVAGQIRRSQTQVDRPTLSNHPLHPLQAFASNIICILRICYAEP